MDVFISLLAVVVALSCLGALLYSQYRTKKSDALPAHQRVHRSEEGVPGIKPGSK